MKKPIDKLSRKELISVIINIETNADKNMRNKRLFSPIFVCACCGKDYDLNTDVYYICDICNFCLDESND